MTRFLTVGNNGSALPRSIVRYYIVLTRNVTSSKNCDIQGIIQKMKYIKGSNLQHSAVLKKKKVLIIIIEIFALFPLLQPAASLIIYATLSYESTIEIIAFIVLPFKHMAILSSVDVEESQSPVHHGFSVKKFLFRFVHNKTNHAEK